MATAADGGSVRGFAARDAAAAGGAGGRAGASPLFNLYNRNY